MKIRKRKIKRRRIRRKIKISQLSKMRRKKVKSSRIGTTFTVFSSFLQITESEIKWSY
jgi:hypothetical protein